MLNNIKIHVCVFYFFCASSFRFFFGVAIPGFATLDFSSDAVESIRWASFVFITELITDRWYC